MFFFIIILLFFHISEYPLKTSTTYLHVRSQIHSTDLWTKFVSLNLLVKFPEIFTKSTQLPNPLSYSITKITVDQT